AEYVAVPERALHRLPDGVDWDAGAFCDNVGVALYAVERGGLRGGETVAVLGAGAFGALAAGVARALGAARVVLIGTRPERLQRLASFADDLFGGSDAVEQARAALGGGADLVVEFAGSADAARQAI